MDIDNVEQELMLSLELKSSCTKHEQKKDTKVLHITNIGRAFIRIHLTMDLSSRL